MGLFFNLLKPKLINSRSMPDLDHFLFDQIREHDDQKTFEHVFHTYYAQLCVFANGITGSREDAKDLVNDCFLELWNKRKSIVVKTSLKSYLYISVRNMALNHLKKSRRQVEFESAMIYPFYKEEEITSQIERLLRLDDLELRLKNSIDSLPQQCRYIFYLNRYEQMSYKEIAQKLDLSVGTVKTQIARALKKIRVDFEGVKQSVNTCPLL
jgi:RNA polymerase sigma-19 factor, ECF subfamily